MHIVTTCREKHRGAFPLSLLLLAGRLKGEGSGRYQQKVERWISSQPLKLEAAEPLQLLAAMPCMADPPRAYCIHYGPVGSHRGYSRALPTLWCPGAPWGQCPPFCALLPGTARWPFPAPPAPLASPQGNKEGTLSAAPGHRSCPGALAVSHCRGTFLRAPRPGRSAGASGPRLPCLPRAASDTRRWPS